MAEAGSAGLSSKSVGNKIELLINSNILFLN